MRHGEALAGLGQAGGAAALLVGRHGMALHAAQGTEQLAAFFGITSGDLLLPIDQKFGADLQVLDARGLLEPLSESGEAECLRQCCGHFAAATKMHLDLASALESKQDVVTAGL